MATFRFFFFFFNRFVVWKREKKISEWPSYVVFSHKMLDGCIRFLPRRYGGRKKEAENDVEAPIQETGK